MARTPKNDTLTEQLWDAYGRSRSIADRNRLCLHYAHALEEWARLMEKRLTKNFRVDHDDLKNAGAVAMLGAIESFDPTRGTTFEQYAWRRVQGGMMDYLRAWGKRGHKPLLFTSLDNHREEGKSLHEVLPGKQDAESMAKLELELMIKRLPEKHQKVFLLKAKGLSHRAIAKELHYSPNWISIIYKEGLCVLRDFRRLKGIK